MRMSNVSRGICVEPDLLPVVMSTDAVEPLAVPVVALTRSLVGGPEDGLDVILSGRGSTVNMSNVSRGICVEPDLLPAIMSTDAVEPLAVPVVALTRSLVGGPAVVARRLLLMLEVATRCC